MAKSPKETIEKTGGSNVDVVFLSDIRKTVFGSKQTETDKQFSTQSIPYPGVSPTALNILRKESFLIKGAIKKVANASNTTLQGDNPDLVKKLEPLKSILLKYGTENVITSGNAWFEVITNNNGEVVNLVPFVTDQIRLMQGGEGAEQVVGMEKVYFNIFEPDEEKRTAKEQVWKDSKATEKTLVSHLVDGRYVTGYNPKLNSAILVKNVNISNKYYGESDIESVADQAILLKQIDLYFEGFFARGTMKTVIIFDKDDKLSGEDKKQIKGEFEKKAGGLNNSFSALITGGNLDMIILDSEVDPDSFVKYREKLRQDILAGMNIPYEIMYSDTSSRNSMPESRQVFSDYSVQPNQDLFLAWLKEISKTLTKNKEADETLSLPTLDTGNNLEETKANSAAVAAGWMTPNDARRESNYDLDPILAGDVLYIPAFKEPQDANEVQESQVPDDLDKVI